MSGRREDAARRDGILCSLALQLPEEERDSPIALARWLKQLQERHFGGLSTWIPDNDERQAFEYWVKESSAGNLAKRIQRAFRAEQATKKPKPTAPPPPPLVWPLGMRQRKERDPSFKPPRLLADSGGSEKVFLECQSEHTIFEVTATIQGRKVAYQPALRPGTFIELNWEDDPGLKASVTYNGWRQSILAQESLRDAAAVLGDEPSAPEHKILQPLAKLVARRAERVNRVMPPDLEAWKKKVYGYRLEIRYTYGEQNQPGTLNGTLLMNMERLWFRFKDEKGHDTPIH